jgi:hypothetical protein
MLDFMINYLFALMSTWKIVLGIPSSWKVLCLIISYLFDFHMFKG